LFLPFSLSCATFARRPPLCGSSFGYLRVLADIFVVWRSRAKNELHLIENRVGLPNGALTEIFDAFGRFRVRVQRRLACGGGLAAVFDWARASKALRKRASASSRLRSSRHRASRLNGQLPEDIAGRQLGFGLGGRLGAYVLCGLGLGVSRRKCRCLWRVLLVLWLSGPGVCPPWPQPTGPGAQGPRATPRLTSRAHVGPLRRTYRLVSGLNCHRGLADFASSSIAMRCPIICSRLFSAR